MKDLRSIQSDLAVKAKSGDRVALDALMHRMNGYVVSACSRFMSSGLPREDLHQSARIGVLRAIEVYDPSRGAFAPAAVYWILDELTRLSMTMSRPVRLPSSRPTRALQYKVMPEIRRPMSSGVSELDAVRIAAEKFEVSEADVVEFIAAGRSAEIDENDMSSDADPVAGVSGSDRERSVRIVRDAVGEKEFDMMMMRFVNDAPLKEISERFGYSRERSSQIVRHALDRAGDVLKSH